jgi:general secretion pathway protein G
MPTLQRSTRSSRRSRGFTLVELMIVLAIIGILLAISVPVYVSTIRHARETVLRDDLFQLRSLIDQYTMDKQQAPQSLDDLVTAGYLRALPKDPFTNSNTTWQPVQDNSLMSLDQTDPGIVDVHSGSDATSSDGTPYSSW